MYESSVSTEATSGEANNPFNNISLSTSNSNEMDTDDNGYELSIAVTALRRNPEYMIYYIYWTRLVVMGILPTILLIYFNYKVRILHVKMCISIWTDAHYVKEVQNRNTELHLYFISVYKHSRNPTVFYHVKKFSLV